MSKPVHSLEEWNEKAYKEVHGYQVHDILRDWELDRKKLEVRIKDLEGWNKEMYENYDAGMWTRCHFIGPPPKQYESWKDFCESPVKSDVEIKELKNDAATAGK